MNTEHTFHTTSTIHTTSPILIIDHSIDEMTRIKLGSCRTYTGKYPLIVDCSDLVTALDRHVESLDLPHETLFVFPGNGGMDVERRLFLLNDFLKVRVFAKRIWYQGNDPVVVVGEIPTDTFVDLHTKVVFILDDVVSSGQTAYKLRSRNEWKFPTATWYLGCWIDRGLKMKGFKNTFSAMTIKHAEIANKKVPINSLSTLVKDPVMCINYAQKNYRDYKEFLHLLELLRK